MKYLLFSTLIAAQLWIGAFESRLNEKMGSHYGNPKEYHYTTPIILTDGVAVPIITQVESYLVATESEELVDSIASFLPEIK